MSGSTSRTSPHMCSQCQHLNMEALFTPTRWHKSVAIRNPDPLHCHLCAALAFIRPDLLAGKSFQLVQLRHPSAYSGFRITAVASEEEEAIWTPHTGIAESCLPGSITLEEHLQSCEKSLLDEAFSSGYANSDMHKRWLQQCRQNHGDTCNVAPDASLIPNLKLIDCETREIHQFQHGDAYSALSYRWGRHDEFQEYHSELPQQLPPTIEDALLVTRELGIRYIWIDRYCIHQNDNAAIKAQQITNMHRIYHCSEVTIIAAAGGSPEYGLPGISRKRFMPPRLQIGGQKFACTPPDPRLLIESSIWSSRGWTYQEGLLSRRRLVFTDQQSYFQCAHKHRGKYCGWSEAISWLFTNRPCKKITGEEVNGIFEFGLRHHEIWSRVNEFTSRHLTCEDDVLNAFLGILETYAETSWPGFDFWHLQGLPMYRMHEWSDIPTSWNNPLLLNLSWEQQCPSSRRQNFPSWSWTGWTGSGFIGPYECLYPAIHEEYLYSRILSPADTQEGPEIYFDQLIEDKFGRPVNWNLRFLTVSTPCITGLIRSRDRCPPTVLGREECPSYDHLPLFNEHGLVFSAENSGRSYSYDFQLQRKDLASHPRLENGIACLNLILDLNIEETKAMEDTELKYRTDAKGRIRWCVAAILVLRCCDEKGDYYERIGKVAIPRRHLRGTSGEYRVVRLG